MQNRKISGLKLSRRLDVITPTTDAKVVAGLQAAVRNASENVGSLIVAEIEKTLANLREANYQCEQTWRNQKEEYRPSVSFRR